MKKTTIFGFLILVGILSSFVPSSKNTLDIATVGFQENWATLSEADYSIQYPEEWRLDQSGQMNTKFMLFSALADASDSFSENVNLIAQDLTGYEMTLDKYVELSENQITQMIDSGSILSSNRVAEGEIEYHKIIFTGKQGASKLKFIQHYYVISDKAFVLTLTCEESQFDAYKATGEQILNSFQINQN